VNAKRFVPRVARYRSRPADSHEGAGPWTSKTRRAGRFSQTRSVSGFALRPGRPGRTRARLIFTAPFPLGPVCAGVPYSCIAVVPPAAADEVVLPDADAVARGEDVPVPAEEEEGDGAAVAGGVGTAGALGTAGAVGTAGGEGGDGGGGGAGSVGRGGGGGSVGGGGGGGGGGVVTVTATVVTPGTVTVAATVVGSSSRVPSLPPSACADQNPSPPRTSVAATERRMILTRPSTVSPIATTALPTFWVRCFRSPPPGIRQKTRPNGG
jgi:hypothetical protein